MSSNPVSPSLLTRFKTMVSPAKTTPSTAATKMKSSSQVDAMETKAASVAENKPQAKLVTPALLRSARIEAWRGVGMAIVGGIGLGVLTGLTVAGCGIPALMSIPLGLGAGAMLVFGLHQAITGFAGLNAMKKAMKKQPTPDAVPSPAQRLAKLSSVTPSASEIAVLDNKVSLDHLAHVIPSQSDVDALDKMIAKHSAPAPQSDAK